VATGGQDARPATAQDIRDSLDGLRAQNRTMIEHHRELLEVMERIAAATKRTASHTFWIALPIWLGLAATSLLFGLMLMQAMALRR